MVTYDTREIINPSPGKGDRIVKTGDRDYNATSQLSGRAKSKTTVQIHQTSDNLTWTSQNQTGNIVERMVTRKE